MDASVRDAFKGRCLDPVPILSPMTADKDPTRCRSQHGCTKDQMCTYPDPQEQLMRIGIQPPRWQEALVETSARIVLWDGPRSEVYEQVIVSNYASQHWWLPPSLPLWSNLFFLCVNMFYIAFYEQLTHRIDQVSQHHLLLALLLQPTAFTIPRRRPVLEGSVTFLPQRSSA
jgi:hypothetical protein